MSAGIRNLIASFLLILRLQVVTRDAWSAFGVRHAAVGQHNGIAYSLDLLGAIAFSHVFELNRWPGRCCF